MAVDSRTASTVRKRLGPAQDHVVSQALDQKSNVFKSKSALGGACVCLCGAFVLAFDLYFFILSSLLSISPHVLWYPEVAGAVLLLALSVVCTCVYIQPLRSVVPVTAQQSSLLGITGNGVGFKTVPRKAGAVSNGQRSILGSPAGGVAPLLRSTPVGAVTPRRDGSGVFSTTPLSIGGPSPLHGSPLSVSGSVSDYTSLKAYWRKEEEKEERFTRGGLQSPPDRSSPHYPGGVGSTPHYPQGVESSPHYPGGVGSTPHYPGGVGEGRVSLREYCLATQSPHTSAVGDKDDSQSFSDPTSIWNKLNISRDVLDVWTENCRKWIAQTVFQPLVQEMKNINSRLESLGHAHYQLGKAPLHTLRHLTITEAQALPTLQMILSYLEVSSYQDYVYQRIIEIGSDSCLKQFKWNGGGLWNGREWNIDLPSDAQIVIHCLCCYLDANLVPLPLLTDKTFSQLHFMKTPSKPNDKTDICIYQTSVNPPHFKVVRKQVVMEIPKGFNNLFYAIIVFLHEIQSKNSGMLGSININLSAVNISWIISNN